MNAWDKLQLGWLDYALLRPGDDKASLKLGPSEATTKQDQAVVVVLPDKQVTTNLGAPFAGSKFYYSGTGDNLDTTMTRSVALPAGIVALSAKVRYNIEQDWDYAYLTVNGNPVATNRSTATSPNGQNFGNGITGVQTGWVDLTADLSSFAGQTVTLGFRYWTDGAQQGQPGQTSVPGFQIDDISITGQPTRRSRGQRRVDIHSGLRRVPCDDRIRDPRVLQRVRRREQAVPRLRRRNADRAVQLRRHDRRELGRAVPVPGRTAGLVLGQLVRGQQRRRPPRWRADPSGRREPGAAALGERLRHATASAVVRRDVHHAEDRRDHRAPRRGGGDRPVARAVCRRSTTRRATGSPAIPAMRRPTAATRPSGTA